MKMPPERFLASSALYAAVLAVMLGIYGYEFVLFRVDRAAGHAFVLEDGPAEWATVVLLVLGAALSGLRWRRLCAASDAAAGARRTWLILTLMLVFGAGEEISWGQRIFGWGTPAWLNVYNNQGETTLHNLQFGNFSVNKVIFGKVLAIVLLAYVLILPLLVRRHAGLRAAVDRLRIPLARPHQVVLWLICAAGVNLSEQYSERARELGELVGAFMFFLVLSRPSNLDAVERDEES